MSALLFLRPEAKAELREAFAWYEGRRVGLGFGYFRTVGVVLAAIERSPEVFPFALYDIRKAPLRRFPGTSANVYSHPHRVHGAT